MKAGGEGDNCRGWTPAGSRGTLRMNGDGERETRRTSLDRTKSARERERERRDQTRNKQQSLAVALFFTIAFIPYVVTFLRGR